MVKIFSYDARVGYPPGITREKPIGLAFPKERNVRVIVWAFLCFLRCPLAFYALKVSSRYTRKN
jgi:hypothetical protein